MTKRTFEDICSVVEAALEREWRGADETTKQKRLEREKRAIMGFNVETMFYKEKIREILKERGLENEDFPPWYTNLSEGVFAELYGLAGLAPWAYDATEKYAESSSAKLIGENLFCLIDGKSVLQPQKIGAKRREKLKRALLLAAPEERLESGFHEVYLSNGIRITIYSGDRTKTGQDIMVFRKYVLKELTFEEMRDRGTIPTESIELFKIMVDIGFNVLFSGQVRSGKTTFLQTWQKYEDSTLEGMAISTDPETPWHEIMRDAPIMQLVADGKKLEGISKSLLRGDNDYVILEEMRDAQAFKLALDITSSGTMRSKCTIHSSDAMDIPYKMASKIAAEYGENTHGIVQQVFNNFDYVLEFCQMPSDRSVKKLKSICEYSYDSQTDSAVMFKLCEYDFKTGDWKWSFHMGRDKEKKGEFYMEKIDKMKAILNENHSNNPMMNNSVIYPRYYNPVEMKGGDSNA